jgi:quercetin dioxygenase-like cupin family protein
MTAPPNRIPRAAPSIELAAARASWSLVIGGNLAAAAGPNARCAGNPATHCPFLLAAGSASIQDLMQRRRRMRSSIVPALLAAALVGVPAAAQEQGVAKPNLLLKQVVEGMPRGDKQEVTVLTANLKPGDKTVFHTHRFPVTVYILEGAFTLELDGREPVTVKAGESMVEPPNVKMTGYNRSATEAIKLVIFYVADPGTPFLDVAH